MNTIEQITLQQILEEVAESKRELKRVIEASETRILFKIEEYKKRIDCLEQENNYLRTKLENIDRINRKKNLIAFGLNISQVSPISVSEKLNTLLGTHIRCEDISDVYQLGKAQNSPIKVEFISYHTKETILKQRSKLKGTSIYLNHDLTKKQQEDNQTLRKFWKESKQDSVGTCYIRANKLFKNGKSYTAEQLREETYSEIEHFRESISAPQTPNLTQLSYGENTQVEKSEAAEIKNIYDSETREKFVGTSQPEAYTATPEPPPATKNKGRCDKPNTANITVKEKLRERRPQK